MFTIPTALMSLLARAALLAVGVALGAWVLSSAEQRGYDRRNSELQAQELLQQKSNTDELLKNIADSAAVDQKAAESIERTNQAAAQRASVLGNHLAAQGAKPFNPPRKSNDDDVSTTKPAAAQVAESDTAVPLLGQSVLDRLTVRVLNDARTNAAPAEAGGTSAGADAEGEASADAPTTITGADFAGNDLEVVRLYHELATRHNGLVDWVNRQCVPETGALLPTH